MGSSWEALSGNVSGWKRKECELVKPLGLHLLVTRLVTWLDFWMGKQLGKCWGEKRTAISKATLWDSDWWEIQSAISWGWKSLE